MAKLCGVFGSSAHACTWDAVMMCSEVDTPREVSVFRFFQVRLFVRSESVAVES